MWLPYLLLALAIIGISYGLSVWSFSAFLDDQGIYMDDDGRYYSRYVAKEEETPPTFTYCYKDSVCEAFQVGSDVLPYWAMQEGIDVIISPPVRVVLHGQDGKTILVQKGDYVVYYGEDRFSAIPQEDFERGFFKIETPED